MTACFSWSSTFQINEEEPVGIWSGAIECSTAPICRVNSWQLACVCKWVSVWAWVCASMCTLYNVCCLISESLRYQMWHHLMVGEAWCFQMVCCYESSQHPLHSGLFIRFLKLGFVSGQAILHIPVSKLFPLINNGTQNLRQNSTKITPTWGFSCQNPNNLYGICKNYRQG